MVPFPMSRASEEFIRFFMDAWCFSKDEVLLPICRTVFYSILASVFLQVHMVTTLCDAVWGDGLSYDMYAGYRFDHKSRLTSLRYTD